VHSESPTDGEIEFLLRSWVILHAAAKDLDSIELQDSNDFGKKGSLLLIAFDQNTLDLRNSHTDRYGREAGSSANVGEPTMPYGNLIDSEHAFPELEPENLAGVCDCSESNFPIPAKKELDIGPDRVAEGWRRGDTVDSECFDDELISKGHRFNTIYIVSSYISRGSEWNRIRDPFNPQIPRGKHAGRKIGYEVPDD
jgi:hypothetical protein